MTVVLLFGLCVAGAGTVVFLCHLQMMREAEYTRVAKVPYRRFEDGAYGIQIAGVCADKNRAGLR